MKILKYESVQNFFVTVFYLDSDPECPGVEYAIKSKQHLVDSSWGVSIQNGTMVMVRDWIQDLNRAVVVDLSLDFDELALRFKKVTDKFISEKKPQFYKELYQLYPFESSQNDQLVITRPLSTDYINLQQECLKLKEQNLIQNLKNFKTEPKTLEPPAKKPKRAKSASCSCDSHETVTLGSAGTKIKRGILESIDFTSHRSATRKLLIALFPREVLATHSLSGKPSPAFLQSKKETKKQLDPNITHDIVEYVAKTSNVSDSLVRMTITTKCADENKMMKQRMRKSMGEENVRPKRVKVSRDSSSGCSSADEDIDFRRINGADVAPRQPSQRVVSKRSL